MLELALTSSPITFFFNNLSLFGQKIVEHLELAFAAVGVSILIAIPLGVWLGHLHRGSFLAISTSNIGRALPSLAVISIGIGKTLTSLLGSLPCSRNSHSTSLVL